MGFEHVDQPAWDRALELMLHPWNERLEQLTLADTQLRETKRNAARLLVIDQDVQHWSRLRDEARRELVDIERRRTMAVDKAVEDAGQRALLGRAKRMEAAREWAEELQEEQLSGPRRVANSRMTGAQRELDQRHEEMRAIGTHPMYRNERLLAWLDSVHDLVAVTLKRDRRARELIATPWLQRRAADDQLLRSLRTTVGDAMVPAATFAEGAVHVIGGGQLALLEVRDGNENLRAVGGNGLERRLMQVQATGERPAGATTGSLRGLLAATQVVERVTGAEAHSIICFHGWRDRPAKVDETILCGPKQLEEVLAALPPRTILQNDLEAARVVLEAVEVTSIPAPRPAPMDELRAVEIDEVPIALEHVRNLLAAAHSTHEVDLREAVGARG